MTQNFQYKIGSGGTWTDVPESAHPDEMGSIELVRPKATAIDGLGQPCGFSGPVNIIIQSSKMLGGARGDGTAGQGTGLMWWNNFFTLDTINALANFYITVFDNRWGGWLKYKGTLLRPDVKGSMWDGSAYIAQDVTITIQDATPTT